MSKVSVYEDFRGFTYTVFYAGKKDKWVMLTYNPEGKYCSHAHYTKEEIKIQTSGFKKVKEMKP